MKFIKLHIIAFSLVMILPFTVILDNASGQSGYVEVYQDGWVDSLVQQYRDVQQIKMQNPDNKGIDGYRVQIFFDSGTYSGDRAREVMEAFKQAYTGIPAYLTWKAPNYRVRVGDFRSKLEAEKFLSTISRKYPNAWIIKDKINFPEMD